MLISWAVLKSKIPPVIGGACSLIPLSYVAFKTNHCFETVASMLGYNGTMLLSYQMGKKVIVPSKQCKYIACAVMGITWFGTMVISFRYLDDIDCLKTEEALILQNFSLFGPPIECFLGLASEKIKTSLIYNEY